MNLDSKYPVINPVSKGVERPFWSVMIPTYNCANYLVKTLESVLAQDPGPEKMQIEVIDDCSTQDDPETVVKEIGQGRVSFYRHPQNVGAQANFTACIQRAKGEWVHILHGDDLVLPGFYEAFRKAAEKEPTLGAGCCRYLHIDENGHQTKVSDLEQETAGIVPDWLERMVTRLRVQCPAIVVKRSSYEKLGGFHPDLFHCADWEMWTRIAAHYPVWYEPQPLASYRVHSASDSSRLIKKGLNTANSRQALEIMESYLPVPSRKKLSEQGRETIALGAVRTAKAMYLKGDITSANNQIEEALKCSRSFNTLWELSRGMLSIGNRKAAINYALEAILGEPLNPKGWKLFAAVLLKPSPNSQ